jgi:phosphate acetyltransferase
VPASRSPQPAGIYIAAPEGDSGKSAIALAIVHRLAATVAKVGVFRPITRAARGDRQRGEAGRSGSASDNTTESSS